MKYKEFYKHYCCNLLKHLQQKKDTRKIDE